MADTKSPSAERGGQITYNIRKPPGIAHTAEVGITAYRILGADLGFQDRIPRDVPQQAIQANLQSFIAGLKLLFPDEAIRSYTCKELALPAFHNLMGTMLGTEYMERIFSTLPRPHEQAKLRSTQVGSRRLRKSLEHNFVSSGYFLGTPIDAPERRREDRKVLSHEELHFSYVYSQHRPELWVGFLLWLKYS